MNAILDRTADHMTNLACDLAVLVQAPLQTHGYPCWELAQLTPFYDWYDACKVVERSNEGFCGIIMVSILRGLSLVAAKSGDDDRPSMVWAYSTIPTILEKEIGRVVAEHRRSQLDLIELNGRIEVEPKTDSLHPQGL